MTRPNTLAVVAVGIVACGLARLNPVWLDTVVLIGIFTLISTSAGLCYGQAGILSMGQGAFAAIGAYATAIGSTKYGIPGWVGLVFAIALPAAVAWGVARMVTGLAPLATALATLALGTMLEIVARNTDALTGGYVGIAGIPPIGGVESGQAFVMLVWVAVCVAVLLYENLMASAYGRALHTVRHDRMRANADGVAVAPLLSATLALSAAMAGVGGWLYAHYITYMSPQSLDTQVSISALLMAVIGGAGYLLGPLLGTVLLIVLGRYLPAQEAQGMFYGGALILSLLLARHGLIGLGQRWLVRRRPASARLPAPVVKPTAMRPESGIAP
jgi:branched-chain amino acid transport system permease protein